ncbi:apolipoprotein N-acyltransferase [Acanthopleuribacter pedis]|uniref:Apolipoprotein N-acyltransferase n=1 Tax=Acanthopleuribacter pedis TaxID=442870 RepID=A0A8J7Q3D5_9BACT|nr:apolipoprotein N-acyltransferase [Acanthopleuribacter pedis]MBO1316876.1 apolipoprotein N-acyltransferase [Acanthopleuribacter pedis]
MKHGLLSAGCCLLTALCLTLAAAPTLLFPLALLALAPLVAHDRRRGWVRFAMGWGAGLLTQAFSYYWIYYTVRDFGGQSVFISGLGAFAFWLFQGLDLGLWLLLYPWFAQRLYRGDNPRLRALIYAVCAAAWWLLLQRWVFPYVFPWSFGSLLNGWAPLMKAAALWSVFGLGFWMVMCQVLFVKAVTKSWDRPLTGAALAALVLPLLLGAGFHQRVETDTWRVGVVQPNLIPWAKRGRVSVEERVRAHLQPTLSFKHRNVDLVVWPETAMSFVLARSERYQAQLRFLAKQLKAPIVTGAVGRLENRKVTNEIWMITPDDAPPQMYRKQNLVLFSERLPWILSWAKFFDPALGGFSAGTEDRTFTWRERSFIPMVCFEALLSDYVRRFEGHAILNLTNDAWFGETKASALHLMMIQARTTELGVPLIRSTNSGISCWVDRDGRIHDPSPLYEARADIYEVQMPRTISRKWLWLGDVLVAVFAVGTLLFARFREQRNNAG